jgi:hypothetical protein
MPRRERSRLTEWLVLLREEWLPAQWAGLVNWFQAVREEPYLAWETPQVRYGFYGLVGVLGLSVLIWALSLLEPPTPREYRTRAETANYPCVCANTDCGHRFMITRKFGFDDYPVACPRCGQQTGQRAVRCHSPSCKGRYVAVVEIDGELRCTECGAVLGPAP